MFSSRLQRALRRGLVAGGDLTKELEPFDDFKVHSKKDAEAVVNALARFPDPKFPIDDVSSPLHSLLTLVKQVDGWECPAFEVFQDAGTGELIRIFDELKDDISDKLFLSEDLLYLLKVLAMYGAHAGAEKIIEAARIPLDPDGFLWATILSVFTERHPEREYVFQTLADPLPAGFIAVSFLDAANRAAIKGAIKTHPFDTAQGKAQLRIWLTNRNPEEFSYAHSSTAALPFITGPLRDELLGLAREHADLGVRLEGAWASAKLGQEIGLQMLRDAALDHGKSAIAVRYLEELGHADAIPTEATSPDFQAKAEFANWLSHPNELGKLPDELEIVDQRTLFWPPAGEELSLWLIKYLIRDEYGLEADDVDCGLVGSTTWCFFAYKFHLRPPEDCYAIHCCWELNVESAKVDNPSKYERLIKRWPHASLTNVQVTHIMEIPHVNRQVVIAKARLDDASGWAVFDEENSLWYPESDFPSGQFAGLLLKIHVGRRLLGFEGTPDRKHYLSYASAEREPGQIVESYEKLLRECELGDLNQRRRLAFRLGNPLGKNLKNYAECCEVIGHQSKSEAFLKVFGILLQIAQELPSDAAQEAYEWSGSIEANFAEFVDALMETSRINELPAVIDQLEPYWGDSSGYSRLGRAAYQCGHHETAERFFIKYKTDFYDWRIGEENGEEMSSLAKLWHQKGRLDEARELLVDCIIGIVKEANQTTNSYCELTEGSYQTYRTTLAELFPGEAASLAKKGLPDSTH